MPLSIDNKRCPDNLRKFIGSEEFYAIEKTQVNYAAPSVISSSDANKTIVMLAGEGVFLNAKSRFSYSCATKASQCLHLLLYNDANELFHAHFNAGFTPNWHEIISLFQNKRKLSLTILGGTDSDKSKANVWELLSTLKAHLEHNNNEAVNFCSHIALKRNTPYDVPQHRDIAAGLDKGGLLQLFEVSSLSLEPLNLQLRSRQAKIFAASIHELGNLPKYQLLNIFDGNKVNIPQQFWFSASVLDYASSKLNLGDKELTRHLTENVAPKMVHPPTEVLCRAFVSSRIDSLKYLHELNGNPSPKELALRKRNPFGPYLPFFRLPNSEHEQTENPFTEGATREVVNRA